MDFKRLAFIGFGEAGRAFVTGWGRPAGARAFDIKLGLEAVYAEYGVSGCDLAAGLRGAEVVFCLVTADQALVAAQTAAAHLVPGTLWFDCNSCAPSTKAAAAKVIDGAGGRYVDVAVMAPVFPKLHKVPLLVAGPHAAAACAVFAELGMNATLTGDTVGQASSIKMLRSVMIKGLEALTSECFLAARRAGVEDQVIASLDASDPGIEWRERGAYNLERMMVHGTRRAAEMREVVKMLGDLGLPAHMTHGTVEWQASIADLGADPGEADLVARADTVLGLI